MRPLNEGLFKVFLGNVDPGGNPLNLSFDKLYWIKIQVGDVAPMTPRVHLTSAEYSFRGIDAEG